MTKYCSRANLCIIISEEAHNETEENCFSAVPAAPFMPVTAMTAPEVSSQTEPATEAPDERSIEELSEIIESVKGRPVDEEIRKSLDTVAFFGSNSQKELY